MVRQAEVNGEQIIPLLHGAALVASKSQPGAWHTVKAGKCDCPGFFHYGRCRHVKAVQALDAPAEAKSVNPLAGDQNELLRLNPSSDPLFLPERPHQRREPRTFEQIFGYSPTA